MCIHHWKQPLVKKRQSYASVPFTCIKCGTVRRFTGGYHALGIPNTDFRKWRIIETWRQSRNR